ncbi:MAG TPA: Maf family protein, partial [bacterium]|nr:Maf family protein [bacterium]
MRRLVLASTSPRRRELLTALGLAFEVAAPRFEEKSDPGLSPEAEALEFAKAKARSLAPDFADALLIGSDTLIEFQGRKLGKPKDAADAHAMLRDLAGQPHLIHTAVAVVDAGSGVEEALLSRVKILMRPAADAEIAAYVATGEPLDKAGAYAIQGRGRELIAEVEGDYEAAVGLPTKGLL